MHKAGRANAKTGSNTAFLRPEQALPIATLTRLDAASESLYSSLANYVNPAPAPHPTVKFTVQKQHDHGERALLSKTVLRPESNKGPEPS